MQYIYRTRDKVWDFYEVRILLGISVKAAVQLLTLVVTNEPL